MSFAGLTIEQAAQQIGKPVSEASHWFRRRGYTYDYTGNRVLRTVPTVDQVEREIYMRRVSAPPSTNCFRCGARGECAHR